MGFGMNKWIYKQRPRKFFKSRNIPLFNEIDQIKSDYNPKFANNPNSISDKKNRKEREYALKLQNKFDAVIVLIISLILIISIVGIYISLEEHADAYYNLERQQLSEKFNAESYGIEIILKSADRNFERYFIDEAISEYKNALNLSPRNPDALIGLVKSYMYLSAKDKQMSKQALIYLNKLKKVSPQENYYMMEYSIYMNLGDTIKSLEKLDQYYQYSTKKEG